MAEARILYLATGDGVIQLANPGRSDRWREVGRALSGQAVHLVAAAPHDPLLVVAATAGTLHRTTDGGMSWHDVWHGPATALTFDQQGALYVGTREGMLLRSEDGATWQTLFQTSGVLSHIVVTADDRVIMSDDRVVYQWKDPDEASRVPFASDMEVVGVAIEPTGLQRVVVVVSSTQIQLASACTGALVLLGGNDPVLLLGAKGPLLRSTSSDVVFPASSNVSGTAMHIVILDAQTERSFERVEGPQHANALVTPPHFLDQAFAGTAHGALWFSADRGRTWTLLRGELPPVHALAFVRAR